MKTEGKKKRGKNRNVDHRDGLSAGVSINEWKQIHEMFPMGISLRWGICWGGGGHQEVGSLELIPTGVADKIYIFTCITFD